MCLIKIIIKYLAFTLNVQKNEIVIKYIQIQYICCLINVSRLWSQIGHKFEVGKT